MRTRYVFASLFVVFSLLLTACTAGPTGPVGPAAPGGEAAVPGGELPVPRNETIYMEDSATFRIFDSFNNLIPNGNDFANGFVQVGTEYFFYANFATGEIQPWLATEYTYNEDFTEVTLKLRDDVTWNDGEPFSADDVVFTVEMLKANSTLARSATLSEFVESVTAPDATTVVFTLTKPAPRFHYNFFAQVDALTALPKHIWEGQDPLTFKNDPPVTTSVWKLKQTLPDLRMFVWERDENYWGKAEQFPQAKYIVFRTAPPADADYQDLVNNVIDHAHRLQWHQVEQALAANPAVSYGPFQDPCPRGIWVNNGKYPLSEPDVRWALSYLVNREKIANVIWQPPTVPAVYPWSEWKLLERYLDPAVLEEYKIEYDPAKAAALLDSLGFAPGSDGVRVDAEGNRMAYNIITPAEVGVGEYQIAQDLAEEAAKIGIELTVQAVTGPVFDESTQTGNFDITAHWLCGSGFMDPIGIYQNYQSKNTAPVGERATAGNWIRLEDAELDAAVEKLQSISPDSEEAAAAYSDALRAWMRLMPAIPVVQTIYIMPWNETYWTNWPTEDNMYTVPFTWWALWYPVSFQVEPVQ
ncbi:MAG: ABC transporter substrate-binding protein [Caldilineaceae bacterium]|nr:ABC transporter substrate-binding protein [Caldilineaceae bacterium]